MKSPWVLFPRTTSMSESYLELGVWLEWYSISLDEALSSITSTTKNKTRRNKILPSPSPKRQPIRGGGEGALTAEMLLTWPVKPRACNISMLLNHQFYSTPTEETREGHQGVDQKPTVSSVHVCLVSTCMCMYIFSPLKGASAALVLVVSSCQ
jgi:hypothetical protein